MFEQAQTFLAPMRDLFLAVELRRRQAQQVENAGWLPHYTTPFELLTDEMSAQEISETIERHYETAHVETAEKFRERGRRYGLDDELTATLEEALSCLATGNFRAVVRLLFPEIERVVSKEIYDGKHTHEITSPNGKPRKIGITSLPEFHDLSMQLPAGRVLDYEYAMDLLKRLENHLYAHVGEDPAEIARWAADPVPNRHAALHGIVVYSTRQHAINTLIMADFIFHLVGAVKAIGFAQPQQAAP